MDQKYAEEEIGLLIKNMKKKDLERFYKTYQTDPSTANKKVRKAYEDLSNTLKAYELDYVDGDKNKSAKKNYRAFKKELKEIENAIKEHKLKMKVKEEEEEIKEGGRSKKPQGKQALIAVGDKLQKDGVSRLEMMNKDLGNGYELVKDCNQELGRQEEVLLGAVEDIHALESSLKRAWKDIAYFSHEFYKDKFFRIMTILILLVFIVV